MVDQLPRARFDGAVIFTVYSQSSLPAAFLCYLAGIPRRLAHCRENPYQMLTHWVPDPDPSNPVRHEVRRQLDLVATIGCRTADERLTIHVSESARRRVRAMLDELDLAPDRPWLAVHCGASAASRRYPPELFAQAARMLVLEHGYELVFTGSESERPLVEHVRALLEAPSHSVVGRLDLEELAAFLAAAPLLLANNTGPVHVAAAVGTPVVDLYALTNPQHTPWHVPSRLLFHDVPCKYCYKSVCPEGHHDCLPSRPPVGRGRRPGPACRKIQGFRGRSR